MAKFRPRPLLLQNSWTDFDETWNVWLHCLYDHTCNSIWRTASDNVVCIGEHVTCRMFWFLSIPLYRMQWTAYGSVFGAVCDFFVCVWNISGTTERMCVKCVKFAGKTSLVTNDSTNCHSTVMDLGFPSPRRVNPPIPVEPGRPWIAEKEAKPSTWPTPTVANCKNTRCARK